MPAKHRSASFFASTVANALAAALAVAVYAVSLQAEDSSAFRLNETLRLTKQLSEATDWQARRAAFNDLVQLGMNHRPSHTAPRDGIRRLTINDDPRARQSLVQSLITAVAAENQASLNRASFSREENELRVDMLWALVDFHDYHSTDVLLDAVNTGNGPVSALAGFGDKSLPKVMERLSAKPDRETKLSLMLVILEMCEDRNLRHLSPESKVTVRQTLLSALKDPDPMIRKTGCKGLALFGDPATIPDLERVASKDPETSNKSKHLTYPIREDAKDAIETIRANHPPPKPETKVKSTG